MHGSVEIPYFIFPVIVILVGNDLFPDLGALSWIGLGTIGTVGTLAAALPAPFFGRLADKYRRGVMMFISLWFTVLGSFSIGLFGESFIIMIVGIILLGLGISLYHPLGLSWITSAFEKNDEKTRTYSSRYVRILALHGVGGTLGAAIGPLSVYVLLNSLGWRQIYFYWAFPLAVIALCFWIVVARHEPKIEKSFILEELPINSRNNRNSSNFNFSIILVFIFAFITTLSITRGMINFILSPFLSEVKDFKIATAALFIGLSTLLGSIGEILGGVLGDKYGERIVLSGHALIQVGILILIYTTESQLVLLLLYIFLGINSSLFWPSTNSLVAKNSTRRGIAFGRVILIANFFGALGPGIDGILLALTPNQYSMIFIVACTFSLLGVLFLILSTRNSENT